MKAQNQHISKRKNQRRKNSNGFLLLLCVLLFSCNYSNKNLLGKYIIDNVKGDTTSHKCIKELWLLKNSDAKIIYNDTLLSGKWEEIDVQEFNYIKLICNGDLVELHILKDSTMQLYFVSNPTNFRGEYYDSLSFKKTY